MPWISSREYSRRTGIPLSTLRWQARRGRVQGRRPEGQKSWEYFLDEETSEPQEPLLPPANLMDALRAVADEGKKAARAQERALTPVNTPVGEVETVAWLSDIHIPDHHVKALAVTLDRVRDLQPEHIIIGGDIGEFESVSSHGGIAQPARLVDECEQIAAILERLRRENPDANIVYLEGNHETRLTRGLVKALPTLVGAVSVPELLGLADLRIKWVREKEPYQVTLRSGQLGEMLYIHGSWESVNHARQAMQKWNHSIRYGHTHRPQLVTETTVDGRILHAVGSPCLRTVGFREVGFTKYPNRWSLGFGIDEYAPDGTVFPRNVVVSPEGVVCDAGKIWRYDG